MTGVLAWPGVDGPAQRVLGEPEPAPAQVGRYRVRTLRGSDGTGQLYAAEDPLRERGVAIRLLSAGAPEASVNALV